MFPVYCSGCRTSPHYARKRALGQERPCLSWSSLFFSRCWGCILRELIKVLQMLLGPLPDVLDHNTHPSPSNCNRPPRSPQRWLLKAHSCTLLRRTALHQWELPHPEVPGRLEVPPHPSTGGRPLANAVMTWEQKGCPSCSRWDN